MFEYAFVRNRHNRFMWHIAHVCTPRAAECARCYDPVILAPGLHAMTDHDRPLCDWCAHDLDVFGFLRLREQRLERAAAAR